MHKERQSLLIAALAGLLIVGAAAFMLQPSVGGTVTQTRLQVSEAGMALTSGLARPA